MMRKVKGFSVIEILTTMVIAAIIASIAAPQYGRMRQESDFNDESKAIFHTISQARANAIAHKKCNGVEATLWGAELGLSEFKLFCNNQEEIETTEITTLGSTINYDGGVDDGNNVRIVFIPETLQSKVLDVVDDTETNKDLVKIVLSHVSSDEEKTICFQRVSGFPTLNKGDVNCSE